MDFQRSPPDQSPYGTPRDLPGPSGAGGFSAAEHSSSSSGAQPRPFDILQWYPKYQNCLRYFVEVSQHSYPCQALAAFINIRLPAQRIDSPRPVDTALEAGTPPLAQSPAFKRATYPSSSTSPPPPATQLGPSTHGWVSLHPYIRRLVATGFDVPAILHGWFGEDWVLGVGPLHEQERRNYLFVAKSGGYQAAKRDYDCVSDEAIPYLKPLGRVDDGELDDADESWSKWLAMEDWMLGSRAPPEGPDTDHEDMASLH